MPAALKNFAWSSLREEYLEYIFLGELCREFWRRDMPVDVLRSHTDRSGFDLVLELGAHQRHVQLKSTILGGRAATQNVNRTLEIKPGGCVVWMVIESETLAPDHFLWFCAPDPAAPMPTLGTRIARHAKANAQGIKASRPNIRVLNKGQFEKIDGFDALATRLFPAGFAETVLPVMETTG